MSGLGQFGSESKSYQKPWPRLYQLSSEKHYASLPAMFNPLHSISDQELFEKHLCNPCIPKAKNGAVCHSYMNYHLKSEISITLCCRLCSTRYTAVRIKNCSKNTTIKIATTKIMDDFRKPSRATAKIDTFCCQKR